MNNQGCERELPQPGEKWRHFKGGEYVIIGIVSDFMDMDWMVYSQVDHNQSAWSQYVRVFDTGSSMVFWMKKESGFSSESPQYRLTPTTEAWHPNDKTEQTLWARPLFNFMGIVSSPYGDQASNCYRFEKIADSVPV